MQATDELSSTIPNMLWRLVRDQNGKFFVRRKYKIVNIFNMCIFILAQKPDA
jgi:hypothetical protein